MIVLIVGVPDSGKSARAEKIALTLAGDRPKIYLATMNPQGEEGIARVARHREARNGKGFITIERMTDIETLAPFMKSNPNASCLLECLSNLVANEMFAPKNAKLTDDELVKKIVDSVRELRTQVGDLTIVSNEFSPNDPGYDDSTRRYVRLLSQVNAEIKSFADRVDEWSEQHWIVCKGAAALNGQDASEYDRDNSSEPAYRPYKVDLSKSSLAKTDANKRSSNDSNNASNRDGADANGANSHGRYEDGGQDGSNGSQNARFPFSVKNEKIAKLIRRFLAAASLYSKLPVPQFEWKDDDLKYSLAFLPWIGAFIGAVIFALTLIPGWNDLSAPIRAALATLVPLIVTGGFHLDGFLDVQDALRSYKPREEKLEILKDPRVGAFALIGLVKLGLIWFAALTFIVDDPYYMRAFFGIFFLARAAAAWTSIGITKARKDGLLAAETKAADSRVYKIVKIETIVGLCYFACDAVVFGCALAALLLGVAFYRRVCLREFGGVTGDTTGYYITSWGECALLAAIAAAKLMTNAV